LVSSSLTTTSSSALDTSLVEGSLPPQAKANPKISAKATNGIT